MTHSLIGMLLRTLELRNVFPLEFLCFFLIIARPTDCVNAVYRLLFSDFLTVKMLTFPHIVTEFSLFENPILPFKKQKESSTQ